MNDKKNNNGLYFIVGALVVAVAILGFFFLQDKVDEPTLSIDVNENGIDIDTNN